MDEEEFRVNRRDLGETWAGSTSDPGEKTRAFLKA